GIDHIQISADGFGGGLFAGGTISLVSGTDPTASASTGQFLFDTDNGHLLWDADGTGDGAAVLIATLSNLPPLDASDFIVV
ncbi:MAG: serralysin, partial [Sphingomonadales bacterium]|nr:serralysin [Sphingomonadales bacterium]